jgi:hypothetical protein
MFKGPKNTAGELLSFNNKSPHLCPFSSEGQEKEGNKLST